MAQGVAARYQLADDGPVTLAEARRRAAALARSHYENFSVASWLLPRALRQPFCDIYAYCRVSDDLADEAAGSDEALALLDDWRGRLRDCYAGQARHWVFVALTDTIDRFAIPPEPFERLLDAFVQDQRQTRYQRYDDLLGYCRNSADPVGHLVLYLAGHRDPERQRLSDRTCTALQLTNFWQDVARDWAMGRVYLPREDLDRFGVTEADLAAGRCTEGYRDLVRLEVERTRALFAEGLPLLGLLEGSVRRHVTLFSAGGLAVLDRIAAVGYDTLSQRPSLSKGVKLALVLRVLGGGQPWR